MNMSFNRVAAVAAVALALPLAITAQPAQALVMQWDYNVVTGFTDFSEDGEGTGTGVVGSNPNSAGQDTVLSWGPAAPAQRSSITVEGDVSSPPELVTNGGSEAGSTFTHNNFTIPGTSTSLATAEITSALTLTPDPGPGSSTSLPPLLFNIAFTETDNVAGGCVTAPDAVPCDDIFVLAGTPDPSQTFTYSDGITYTVFLDLLGVGPLADDICLAAGADAGCVGITTQENLSNDINTRFRIVAAVPEPGTLSIMALGLLCLALAGFSRNRRTG